MWIADLRAEWLAAASGGAEVNVAQERADFDNRLLEPPLSEITDPKQRMLRMLREAG